MLFQLKSIYPYEIHFPLSHAQGANHQMEPCMFAVPLEFHTPCVVLLIAFPGVYVEFNCKSIFKIQNHAMKENNYDEQIQAQYGLILFSC